MVADLGQDDSVAVTRALNVIHLHTLDDLIKIIRKLCVEVKKKKKSFAPFVCSSF